MRQHLQAAGAVAFWSVASGAALAALASQLADMLLRIPGMHESLVELYALLGLGLL